MQTPTHMPRDHLWCCACIERFHLALPIFTAHLKGGKITVFTIFLSFPIFLHLMLNVNE